jgi:hypothetical protein
MFERWGWGADAAAGLRDTLAPDGALIAEEVRDGIADLWRIDGGAAWLITRAEGDELVIVCLQGRGARKIINTVIERARRAGFLSLRAHTKRPGLLRMFEALGVRQREIVLELDL